MTDGAAAVSDHWRRGGAEDRRARGSRVRVIDDVFASLIFHLKTQKMSFWATVLLGHRTRHFVTLKALTWQWIRTETVTHWHVSDKIWELHSQGCACSVPNPRGPLKALFDFAVQKLWVCV